MAELDENILDTEDIVLKNLLYNEDYFRAVLPHIKTEYFSSWSYKTLFDEIEKYSSKYNARATKEALLIEIEQRERIDEDTYKECVELLNVYHAKDENKEEDSQEWLLNTSEQWCQKRALRIAIEKSIGVVTGENKDIEEGQLPELLSDAISVCFDNSIGHDYLVDAEERWNFYHSDVEKIPFDIDVLNKITKGGVYNKSLNILMGGTGTFKSGTLCHLSSSYLSMGKNVLYITLEMSEERIAERIDANLLNVPIDYLENIPLQEYQDKIKFVQNKTQGKLIVKEYPTGAAHAGHFRHLLRELKLKKQFTPDIIVVDYLNICASSRIKGGAAANSYTIVKSIAEELRGLAVEFDVPLWSATQVNRDGFGSTDVDLTNTSESFGLPATADLFLAIITSEELDGLNQLMFKQLKNRYNDLNYIRKFVVGVDKSKMRLYDTEQSAQAGLNTINTPKGLNTPESIQTHSFPDNKKDKFAQIKV